MNSLVPMTFIVFVFLICKFTSNFAANDTTPMALEGFGGSWDEEPERWKNVTEMVNQSLLSSIIMHIFTSLDTRLTVEQRWELDRCRREIQACDIPTSLRSAEPNGRTKKDLLKHQKLINK
jgi:hypothetical protein